MSDPLKDIHGRSFIEGQEALAKEVSARRFKDQAEFLIETAKVANDTIDEVEKLASDGNPHKQRIAEAVREGIMGAMGELASGRALPQEGGVPIEENPFSSDSPKSVMGSPDSIKALPSGGNEQPAPPKRRGRPPGSKSHPKPEQ